MIGRSSLRCFVWAIRLHKIFGTAMDRVKPEAAYFFPEHGLRSAMMIFDMKDASEIPAIRCVTNFISLLEPASAFLRS